MIDKSKYIMGCDPYDKLNWVQRQLKKIGFYRNRPHCSVGAYKVTEEGIEVIKIKP